MLPAVHGSICFTSFPFLNRVMVPPLSETTIPIDPVIFVIAATDAWRVPNPCGIPISVISARRWRDDA